jgi:hypothetical protein
MVQGRRKIPYPSVRFVVEAGVSTHSFQPKFVSPERLKQLQEIFDLAWQEISALADTGIEGDNANRLPADRDGD